VFRAGAMYSDKTLFLRGVSPFAEGVNRFCFVHPDDNKLCIKVVKEGSIDALRVKRSFWKNLRPDSYFDDNLNEYKAYQQAAIQGSGDEGRYDHIPRCYGWQKTDMGMGLVLDYFEQDNGQPCVTLEAYLKTHGFTPEIDLKLQALADYVRRFQVMTKNILPHNVVFAADGRLKIIDGLGAPSGFSVVNFSRVARGAYIERRIKRMFLRARWESGGRVDPWKDVEHRGFV